MESFLIFISVPSNPHIAHTVHRLDVLAALRFNFVPHPADGRSQGVFIHKVPIGIPQLFKQYLPGQNILRVLVRIFNSRYSNGVNTNGLLDKEAVISEKLMDSAPSS